MSYVDWWVFVAIAFAIIAGGYLVYGSQTKDKDYYTAGRRIPWYVAGTSMSATSLSSDTPLLVASLVFSQGISGNWIWWVGAPAVFATAFFFARLWWRSGVATEMELITFRYGHSKPSKLLRGYKALSDGIIFNSLLIASITIAFNHVALQLGITNQWPLILNEDYDGITTVTLLVFLLLLAIPFWLVLEGLYFQI